MPIRIQLYANMYVHQLKIPRAFSFTSNKIQQHLNLVIYQFHAGVCQGWSTTTREHPRHSWNVPNSPSAQMKTVQPFWNCELGMSVTSPAQLNSPKCKITQVLFGIQEALWTRQFGGCLPNSSILHAAFYLLYDFIMVCKRP